MVSIYVAAASQEPDRVRNVFQLIKENPKLELAQDWLTMLESFDVSEDHLEHSVRKTQAESDLRALRRSPLVWFLAPVEITRGAWVELGYVTALKQFSPHYYKVVISGHGAQSIFCALGEEVPTDEAAYARVCELADELERMRWMPA